jgi:phage major head subunit gpT-like protein
VQAGVASGVPRFGFTALCYDGQPFFDTEHPAPDDNGPIESGGRNFRLVSNMDDGGGSPGPTWYLLDTSRPIKPPICQSTTNTRKTIRANASAMARCLRRDGSRNCGTIRKAASLVALNGPPRHAA